MIHKQQNNPRKIAESASSEKFALSLETASRIPLELRSLPQWVVYQLVDNGKPKFDKIPYQTNGRKAQTDNPETWTTFDNALKASVDFHGLGFVFSKDDPYCGIDLDHCRDSLTGNIDEWALRWIKYFNSYTEVSPSGKGVHIIVKGKLPKEGRKKGNIECYDQGRFFTITGVVESLSPEMPLDSVHACDAELKTFHQEVFHSPKPEILMPKTETFSLSDSELIERAKSADNGQKFTKLWEGDISDYPSWSEADLALCSHLAFWCRRDASRIDRLFRQSGLKRDKWDEKRGDHTYGQLTIKKAIENYREVYKGTCTASVEVPVEEKRTQTITTFPYEIMSGVAGNFAETYGAVLEPPCEFFYMSFLTLLGSILADRITVQTEIHPQPRLYVVLLGESADERKSTAINKTVLFFERLFADRFLQEQDGFKIANGVGSAEGLLKLLNKNKRVIIIFDEFSQFVNKAKIQGSVLLQCVNTLYENNTYGNATKQSIVEVRDVHLSILAASTANTYKRIWDGMMTDIGFTNRLFIVPGSGDRKYALPREVDSNEITRLRGEVLELFHIVSNHTPGGLKMEVTPDAQKLYEDWYFSRPVSIHTKRLDTYALRIAPLIALSDRKSHIDRETIEKVLALINWEFEMRKEYDPIDAEGKVARMETSIIRQLQKGPMTKKELKDGVNAYRSGLWVFQMAIKNLQAEQEIRFHKNRWMLIQQDPIQ